MQLIKAHVKHFRSLRDVSVSFGAHTAMLGGNGAGKSSILKAIEKFYSTSKLLEADDHFGKDLSVPVEIELTFGELSEQEAEVFESRVRDGKLIVKRIFDGTSSSGRYVGAVMQNPDFAPIRTHLAAGPKIAAYRKLRADFPVYTESLSAAASAAAAENNMLEWEKCNPEKLVLLPDDGQFFGFQNAGRGALARYTSFVFVPAVRDALIDGSDGKASAIGKLLELVVRSAILKRKDVMEFKNEMAAKYKNIVAPENMPELGHLAERLTRDLKGLYRDAAVGLTWRPVMHFPIPLPVADVSLSDDGFGGPVDRQGHGLQRALVFTLLQNLAKSSIDIGENVDGDQDDENTVRYVPNLILAIEEPELYQHPTKQRHLATVLRGLSNGTLPGAEGPTQIIFGSHSPMFVSLEKAHEIRLVRRTDCDESNYKQCELKSLDLSYISRKIETAWQYPFGAFTAETLAPRLHILGTELAEGFFANGVVLVEGRSDKAMLHATIKLFDRSFEEAGIAVLAADGKTSLDKPYLIFRELGIPVYIVWDCDNKVNQDKANVALLRLVRPLENLLEAKSETVVGSHYAHFEDNLESTLRLELTEAFHKECLALACEPFGLTPSKDTQKIPEVMYQTLDAARKKGRSCETLEKLLGSIWFHLTGEQLYIA